MLEKAVTGVNFIEPKPRATWMPSDPIWILRLLGGNWRLMALSGLVCMFALLAVLVVLGPRYEITAKILVQLGRELTASPTLGAKAGAQLMPMSMRPEDTAAVVEILSNPSLIRRVVEHFGEAFFADLPAETLWQQTKRVPKLFWRSVNDGFREVMILLGLRPPTTPLERVMLAIGQGLQIGPVRRSDVIEVKLSFPDPHAGVLVLEKFIEFAVDGHIRAHRRLGVKEFFATERAARSAELRETEQRLLAIRSERAGTWSAPEQRSLLLKTETDLQFQLALALAEVAQSAAEIAHARAALDSLPAEVQLSSVQMRNKLGDDLKTRRIQLQLELTSLRARYAGGSPEVSDVQRQIDALSDTINAEPPYQVEQVTTGANQQYSALARDLIAKQNHLEGQRARSNALSTQLTQLRELLRSVEAAAIEIDELQRQVAGMRRSVDLYESGLDDARIAEAMEVAALSNLKVIMPATADLLPASPRITRFLAMGFLGGLILAIAAIFFREFSRANDRPADQAMEVARSTEAPSASASEARSRMFKMPGG